MHFPSWPDFKNGLSKFEGKITEFKKEHPDWDRAINGVITFLPPPFDSLADKIYNSFDGSGEEKANAVLSYLKHLEGLGEKHYNQIALQLNKLLIEINDLKQITAKESTLQIIQDTLTSSGKETNQNLDLLRNELDKIGGDVKEIKQTGQDTNKRVIGLESKYDEMMKYVKAQFTELKMPRPIVSGESIEIPEDARIEIDKGHREIERLRAELEKVHRPPELDIDYVISTANAYYYTKNYEKAIELYDLILEKKPNNLEALNGKGATLNELRKYQEAMPYLTKALEIDPKNVYTLTNKGKALYDSGMHQEAKTYIDKVVEIDPKFVIGLYNKGEVLFYSGMYREAISYYDKALEIDPKNVNALNSKGAALTNLFMYQEAISYYDKALEIDPKYEYALNNKKNVLEKLGKK